MMRRLDKFLRHPENRWISFVGVLVGALMMFQSVHAQLGPAFPGPGMPASAGAAYQGPGDISINSVTGGWTGFWSIARAYNGAYANGTNPLADLVDVSTGATAICTLRVLTTGFVDLAGTYCTGSLTPAAACAAAAGLSCKVTRVYDQTGSARHQLQATLVNMPGITFSAISGLPAFTCAPASTCFMSQSGVIIVGQPLTLWAVHNLTNSGAAQEVIGQSGVNSAIGIVAAANLAQVTGGTAATAAATNGVWHAHSGLLSGSGNNCAINIDGTDAAGLACGVNGFGTVSVRIMRGASAQAIGSATEIGLIPRTSSPTDRNNLRANAKSGTFGYGAGLP